MAMNLPARQEDFRELTSTSLGGIETELTQEVGKITNTTSEAMERGVRDTLQYVTGFVKGQVSIIDAKLATLDGECKQAFVAAFATAREHATAADELQQRFMSIIEQALEHQNEAATQTATVIAKHLAGHYRRMEKILWTVENKPELWGDPESISIGVGDETLAEGSTANLSDAAEEASGEVPIEFRPDQEFAAEEAPDDLTTTTHADQNPPSSTAGTGNAQIDEDGIAAILGDADPPDPAEHLVVLDDENLPVPGEGDEPPIDADDSVLNDQDDGTGSESVR